MKIAIVGQGGREHAIVRALSGKGHTLLAMPGNGGISMLAECVPIAATDVEGVVKYCSANAVDYVVVASDDPLVLGMVDALSAVDIPAFGPSKAAAQLEGSKGFAKWFMQKYGIPTASSHSFTDINDAISHIEALEDYPTVIKADGLALGKGVIIAADKGESLTAVRSMLEGGAFGESGKKILVEEFMVGTEMSILAFCDGKTVRPMISAKDHKRALDGDKGLNTGGMGTIAPHPLYTEELGERCLREIMLPTIEGMAKEGMPFKGCLYFELMLTASGPKVLEYNCRFGDPEAQVVLPLLKTDLLDIMQACTNGTLSETAVEWQNYAAACVIMASGGYPESYSKGYEICGLDDKGEHADAIVYHAGTVYKDGKFLTSGGRVLGITATAPSLEEALQKAYGVIGEISFQDAFWRKDIGITN